MGGRPVGGDGDALLLSNAVESARLALVDYEAGLLDDDQFRRVLTRAALVEGPDRVWLLDLDGARWLVYRAGTLSCDDAPAPPAELTAARLAHWRAGLEALAGRGGGHEGRGG